MFTVQWDPCPSLTPGRAKQKRLRIWEGGGGHFAYLPADRVSWGKLPPRLELWTEKQKTFWVVKVRGWEFFGTSRFDSWGHDSIKIDSRFFFLNLDYIYAYINILKKSTPSEGEWIQINANMIFSQK